jgi:ribosomal-protein-alanine N-acetyltransferase
MTHLESERLYYREFIPADDVLIFELDSNPLVHRYLGNKPYTQMSQAQDYVAFVIRQYEENGIGRMAAFLKETDEFIGWAGLKLVENLNGRDRFYDVGYRLLPQFWGKGYATESARFFVEYGFTVLNIPLIIGMADSGNLASRRALEKTGLVQTEIFDYDGETVWLEIANPAL